MPRRRSLASSPLPALLLASAGALSVFRFAADGDAIEDHRRFGHEMGRRFADTIRVRFAMSDGLARMLLQVKTPDGRALYDAFVAEHDRLAPLAMAELRGIADGSSIPFEHVFLQNIPLEYADCYARRGAGARTAPRRRLAARGAASRSDHCSDWARCSDTECFIGHNEDNGRESLNRTALVKAAFGRGEAARSFTAYTYLGELPSGAFGFNSHAIGFTLNWLGPTDVRCPGLGRGFISRAMLDASTLDGARALAASAAQSAGHNYQLFDAAARKIVHIEAAPAGLYAARPVGETALFHANQYILLDIPQVIGNSSAHRTARAQQMVPPITPADALVALGDQHDAAYPMFHDEASHRAGDLSDWTIASALFDLRRGMMRVYWGNPAKGAAVMAEERLVDERRQ